MAGLSMGQLGVSGKIIGGDYLRKEFFCPYTIRKGNE